MAIPGSPWVESDDFERPDGDLGADWALRYLWLQPPDVGVTVKGGEMCQFGDDEVEATYLIPVPSDDMRVEFTVGTLVANNYTIQLRGALDAWPTVEVTMGTMPPPPGQGMEPYMGPKIVTKNSSSDGGVAHVQAPWEAALLPGQLLSFEVVGNVYTFKVDGVEKATATLDHPTGPNNRLVRVSMSSAASIGKLESTLDNFQVIDLGPLLPVEYTLAQTGDGTLTATAVDPAPPEPPVTGGSEGQRVAIRVNGVMWFAGDTLGPAYACGVEGEPITFSATVASIEGDPPEEPVTQPGEPVRVAIRIAPPTPPGGLRPGGRMWFVDNVFNPTFSCGGVGGAVTFSATVAPRSINPNPDLD